MVYGYDDDVEVEVELEASYEFESEIDVDLYVDLDVYDDLEVDHEIDVCVDIDGNEAVATVDVQAFGDDSATRLDLIVIAHDDYSSITAVAWAAVD